MAKREVHVEVLRRTERNAVLVTDGTKASWMQGRCVREDGTLTKWGMQIIDAATMTDAEARDYDATLAKQKAEREAERERARQEYRTQMQAQAEVLIKRSCWMPGTAKAFKFWTGNIITNMYKQRVREFVYLPTSQVKAEVLDRTVKLTMPTWLKNQTRWGMAIA